MNSQFNCGHWNSCEFYSQLESMCEHTFQIESGDPKYETSFKLGSASIFGTAAYWIYQWHENPIRLNPSGRSLLDETLYCMLGGFGITGELSNAYYDKIKSVTSNISKLTSTDLACLLNEPVIIAGKQIRYRYPNQKAKFISQALLQISELKIDSTDAVFLRNQLLNFPGIGMKTASWIVRNYLGSESVAIIDIHVHRAGIIAGFFKKNWTPSLHYQKMEDSYLKFSKQFNLSPAGFDLMIWNHMRLRGGVKLPS